jgi:hypothetical protein
MVQLRLGGGVGGVADVTVPSRDLKPAPNPLLPIPPSELR